MAVLSTILLHAAPGFGVTTADALPDLVSDPPDNPSLSTYVDTDGERLLLRFDGYVHNTGEGALEVQGGTGVAGSPTRTVQRIYGAGGATSRDDDGARIQFVYETADGHNHWHLIAAMRYGLYDATKSRLVAPATKAGFCLVDTQRVGLQGPEEQVYRVGAPTDPSYFCWRLRPDATAVRMGVSAGWRDVYHSGLAFQWIDVSDVAPGEYWLGADSDPDGKIIESDESNNVTAFARSPSVVPGWLARAVAVDRQASGEAVTVPLGATPFGASAQGSEPRYRVESAPAHGTLNVGAGQDVPAGTALVYTPAAGWDGADSFLYSARDPGSGFPVHPPQATVSIAVRRATVGISGAPASLAAGTSAQLTALVTSDPPAVTWSVDGVPGGNAAVGTIGPGGLYTAPASVPPAGSVRVRAASATASDEVTIAIVAPSPPAPAPTPSTGGAGGGGQAPDLELTMTADRTSVAIGETIAYTLQVRLKNVGASSGADSATVVDTLPAGLELVSAKANRGPGCAGATTVTCPLDFVSATVVGTVEIVARRTAGGPLANTAVLRTAPADLDLTDNSASVTVGAPTGPLQPPTAPAGRPPVTRQTGAIRDVAVGRLGRQLLIGGTAGLPGMVEVTARRRAGRPAMTCTIRARRGQSFTCSLDLVRGEGARGIVVTLRLTQAKKVVAQRRLTLSRVSGVQRDGVEVWEASAAPAAG